MPGIEDLYPMGLEAARKASDQMADQDMMGDSQNKLPANARFSGTAGLLPWVGYTRPPSGQPNPDNDFRAKVQNVAGGRSGRSILRSGKGAPIMGQYLLENPKEGSDLDTLGNALLLEIGADTLQPGEIWFNELPSEMLQRLGADLRPEEIINHELTHRSTDKTTQMMVDFMEFVRSSGDFDTYEKERIDYLVNRSSGNEKLAQEMGDLSKGKDSKVGSSVALMDKAFREFLTPDKQEMYGIRLPVPAAQPKEAEQKSWWQR